MATIESEIKILHDISTNEQNQMQWYMTIIPGPGEGDVRLAGYAARSKPTWAREGKHGSPWEEELEQIQWVGLGREGGSESIT